MTPDFTLKTVEIDGVAIPANQAADGVRAAVVGSDGAVALVHDALAQPVGAALSGSKAACDAVTKRVRKFMASILKSTDALMSPVVDALGGYMGGTLAATAAAVEATGRAAATGDTAPAPPTVPPVILPGGPAPPDTPPRTTGPATPGAPVGQTLTPAPGAPWVVYADCAVVRDICHGGYDGTSGIRVVQQDVGDTIPCPAVLSCKSPVWHRYPGLSWPSNPGPIPSAFDLHLVPGDPICQWADACLTAPPAPGNWNIWYYFDPCADPNGLHCWQAGVFPSNPGGGWILFHGAGTNFPTQPAAQAALDSSGPLLDAINVCPPVAQLPSLCAAPQPPTPTPPPTPGLPPPGPACPEPTPICIPPLSTEPITIPVTDCVFSPQEFEAPQDGYCDRWIQLVSNVVNAGKSLIALGAQGSINDTYLIDNVSCLFTDRNHPRRFVNTLRGCFDRATFCKTLDWWSKALAKYLCPSVDDLRAVLAVKIALQMYADAKFGASGSADDSSVQNDTAGAELLKLGAHKEWSEGDDTKLSLEYGVRPYLVPAIEIVDRVIHYLCPTEIPAVGDVIAGYLKLTIDHENAVCLARMSGADWGVWNTIARSRRERITPEQLVNLSRRLGIDDDSISANLRAWGFLDKTDSDDFIRAYDELPTVSDVLHFLQRNVFDAAYVADYGLMEGFDDRFWPRYGAGLRAIGVLEQTAKDHYAAHWINPSVGQLAEMAQRLRPGRSDPAVQFEWKDFLRVLAEQDVAPYFRERLRAISYRTLPVRQLTQLVLTRTIDAAELSQRWQDIGYKPADADMLSAALQINAARQRATQQHGYTPAVVAKLWPAGQISRKDAYAVLSDQGMTPKDVDTLLEVADKSLLASQYEKHTVKTIQDYATLATKAYADGVVTRSNAESALSKAGYSPEAIALELDTVALRVRMEKIDAARNAVHKSFLRGEVNAAQAHDALVLVGVLDYAATDYVDRWALEMTVPRKSAAMSQILKWAKEGIISVANAEARLLNLGWNPPDIVLMLAEIDQTIRQAAALAAERSAKALAAASAARDRASKAITRQYCRLYTPGKLKLWYSERIIDDATLRDRLTKCGYTAESIDAFAKEAQVARDKRDEQAAKKGPLGIEYTGPGAIP